jgi:hypothetical protein
LVDVVIKKHLEKAVNREQVINNMCMTYRHDYGLEISEDDRMYTLTSGMTKREREALYNTMAQIFDNDIAPYMEFKV